MAVAAYKTYSAGEILTASDLNASFSQIHNNGTAIAFPLTASSSAGGFKITSLAAGTNNGDAVRFEQLGTGVGLVNEFRLTLTTALPVTTGDVTAAETLYWTPYKGNRVALYDGSSTWNVRTSIELSIDVPDVTGVHDVFVYDNGGTPALEVLVWTNETTRATALTTQDGVLVKTGATTRRYVGTFYSTTAGNGQIEDSFANRYLWNYYNRVARPMRALEATNSWAYTLATIRQANGSTANQLNFVVGVSEDTVSANLTAAASHSAGNVDFFAAIGQDSTTAVATGSLNISPLELAANQIVPLASSLKAFPGIGKRFWAWLEWSQASGTTTWLGDNNASPTAGGTQAGIHGEILG